MFLYVYGCFAPVYVCALISVPNTCGGQKRVSHLLEQELQMIVNCQVGAGK